MKKPKMVYSQILYEYALGMNCMFSNATSEEKEEMKERALLLSDALFDKIKDECEEVLLYEFDRMEKENSEV